MVLALWGDMAGNSASLRDSLTLRLASELADLRAANADRRRFRGSVRIVATPANRKATLSRGFSVGWDGRIRTDECGSQSPVPYRLATSHCGPEAFLTLRELTL